MSIKSFIRLLVGMQLFKILMGTWEQELANEMRVWFCSESQVLTSLLENVAYETLLMTFMTQIYLFPNKTNKQTKPQPVHNSNCLVSSLWVSCLVWTLLLYAPLQNGWNIYFRDLEVACEEGLRNIYVFYIYAWSIPSQNLE